MDGRELKEWRLRHEITQKELAEILRTTNVSVARWETGVSPVPTYLDLALAEVERRLAVNPMSKITQKRKGVRENEGSKNQRKKTG